MPAVYLAPPTSEALRQGELLKGLWEHRALAAASEVEDVLFDSVQHPFVFVMTPDCDLEQDHRVRSQDWESKEIRNGMIVQVVCCEAYEGPVQAPGSDIRKRIIQNQDERYHHFPDTVASEAPTPIPTLCLDFKRVVAVPLASVYLALADGSIERTAMLGSPYVFDVIHRFYAFHGRIGVD